MKIPAQKLFGLLVAISLLMLLPAARAQQTPGPQIKSFSVGPDQALSYPKSLANLPDEHTTLMPPSSPTGPYLLFGASNITPKGEFGAVILQTTDLKNFDSATALGYNAQVMAGPVPLLGECDPAYFTEFDGYAAPGSVVQDPTLPAGNFIMIYEAENHCSPGVFNMEFYATAGFARSSDSGRTWPAPINGISGGPARHPVLQSSDPQPSAPHGYEGDALPSAFVDLDADGNYYLYVTYGYVPASGNGDGLIRVARAPLGVDSPNFEKWYNGSFSQPGIGGSDTGVTPSTGCGGGQSHSEINYNDDLGLYLLIVVCVNGPTGSRVGAWYYSTATSLDRQDWTTPQMIQNSQFPVTVPCPGRTDGSVFDGWYPSSVSPGAAAGHTRLTGSFFYLNGCGIGARQFMSRTFTITPTFTCNYAFNLSAQSFPAWGGTGTITITTGAGCPWAVGTLPPGVTIIGAISGTGNGAVTFQVKPNAGGDLTGSLTIAGQTFTIEQAAAQSLQLLTVAPCRIMDTRNANGTFGGPFIAGGTSRAIPIPSSACGVPANAAAYSLNFTVVPRTGKLGSLTVWPTGSAQPMVSALTSPDGSVLADAALVPAGTGGAITAYSTDDTDLVVDINGYFVPPSTGTLQFYPLPPCRVLDTRLISNGGSFPPNSTFGSPSLDGVHSRSYPIPSSSCGVPAKAAAYSLNVTAVPQGALGFVTAWPTGQTQPFVSTMNSYDGTVLANAAIVPAGSGGAVSFYASNPTDLVVDINGYFAPPGSGGLNFYTVPPCRLVNTQNANGTFGGPTMGADTTRSFPLSQGSCGLPAYPAGQAYSLTMTVTPQGGPLGYLSTWPTGGTQPFVSTLNAYKGLAVANAALVPSGTGSSINVFVTNTTDLIIDTAGYFGP